MAVLLAASAVVLTVGIHVMSTAARAMATTEMRLARVTVMGSVLWFGKGNAAQPTAGASVASHRA